MDDRKCQFADCRSLTYRSTDYCWKHQEEPPGWDGYFETPEKTRPKFQPKFNFRFLSYAVIALGVTASITFVEKSEPGRLADDYWRFLSEASCCLSIILAFVFDAVFYKGKADWQAATGQSNTWSLTGMIFDILFAGVVVLFGFMWFIVWNIS